jgi:F0F1-type ATP synthase gamma subunit
MALLTGWARVAACGHRLGNVQEIPKAAKLISTAKMEESERLGRTFANAKPYRPLFQRYSVHCMHMSCVVGVF